MDAAQAGGGAPLKLWYFKIDAAGLGPALALEFSGLPWEGPASLGWTMDAAGEQTASLFAEASGVGPGSPWAEVKAAPELLPFPHLPLLWDGGRWIGQGVAIQNHIGRRASMEGSDLDEYTTGQILIQAARGLYSALGSAWAVPATSLTPSVPLWSEPDRGGMTTEEAKAGEEQYARLWSVEMPTQLARLDALLAGRAAFTASGTTAGELYLWSMLHQVVYCNAEVLAGCECLGRWYYRLLEHPTVQKVVSGQSAFGVLERYWLTPTAPL
jgi:hypothetical protein